MATPAVPKGTTQQWMCEAVVSPIALGMPLDDLVRLWGPSTQEADRDQDGVVLYDSREVQGVLVFLKDDRVAPLIV